MIDYHRPGYQRDYYAANREDIMSRRAIRREYYRLHQDERPDKRGRFKYATESEAVAAARSQRQASNVRLCEERRAVQTREKQREHKGWLHQFGALGYSSCVPPPVRGSIAMMLFYGEQAGGMRL